MKKLESNFELLRITGGADCGQKVADCVADAYANHGWTSVGAFLLTAFVPEYAVAIAAACAAKNC